MILRDYKKDYKESEKWYLKSLALSDKHFNGSYGYLLYLMGEYDKAMGFVQKELKLTGNKYIWGYFYLGLLQRLGGDNEDSEVSLMKAVEVMKSKSLYARTLITNTIMRMISNDESNKTYYTKFLELGTH